MTKVLLLHKTLDHEMTNINEIHDHIALLTDFLTDPLTDMTLVTDVDHAHIQEITTILQDTHLQIDNLHDRDSRFSRTRSNSNTRNKRNTIQPQNQTIPHMLQLQIS